MRNSTVPFSQKHVLEEYTTVAALLRMDGRGSINVCCQLIINYHSRHVEKEREACDLSTSLCHDDSRRCPGAIQTPRYQQYQVMGLYES